LLNKKEAEAVVISDAHIKRGAKMKKMLIILILIMVSLLFSFTLFSQPQSPTYMAELITKAKNMLAALEKGDYEAAVKDFDAAMMKAAPPEKMKQVWEAVNKQLGGIKNEKGIRTETGAQYDVVFITLEFEKSTIDMKVVFNKDKQIAGQFFTAPPVPYSPPAYADPDLFTEKEVEFGVEGWKLPGTISIPKGEGPFPAVVLVHGSGPNDRDESVGGNKPFKDLAWGLASRKIAVLRYDKRTRVHGHKMIEHKDKSLTVYEETVQDAALAVELLRNTERIDPEKVFILGHSLGGTLVPRMAAESPHAAGFIVMAGASRPLEDLFLEQIKYIYMLDGALSQDEEENIAETEAAVDIIKKLTQEQVKTGERILGAGAEYWFDLKGYAPAVSAKSIERPMLILQGGRDYQVTEEDYEKWQEALASKKNAVFKLYPPLNHLFIAGQGPSTPEEYQQPGHVAETVITDIAAWLSNPSNPRSGR
jgi:hypothetical protein